jgi:ABC-2 type transport system permease protein
VTVHSAPRFLTHLRLLWGVRLDIGLNSGRSRWLSILGFIASSAPSIVLGMGFYSLMGAKVIARSNAWPEFILNLLCFVTTAVWATWPVMSAGVDDHSEISRYSAFPISSFRLLAASTLATMAEPRALVFYGPVTGAALGYLRLHPPSSWLFALMLFVAFVLFNAAVSRVGLHLVLNVLRQQRSAELIGGFFVLFLIGASFIPPIDTSWLTEIGANVQAVPDSLIADAQLALGRFPSGWFGQGLAALGHHAPVKAVENLFGTIELTMITMVIAYGLLLQFHRQTGRAGPGPSAEARSANPFQRTQRRFSTLVVREAIDLWYNPRARLLAAVPFVLSILLKLLGGRGLFSYFLGATADAWVLGGLSIYGAVVIGSTFSQNTFAYDGHGFSVFLAAPVKLGDVLKAKNLVHASAALLLAVLEMIFYRVYFGHGTALDLACAFMGVVALIPALLTAGNFLSLYFPVKFHANLKRRDKLPFVASMLGVAAASAGSAPWGWALRLCGKEGPNGTTLLLMTLSAALAWVVYRGFLPLALRLLEQRREIVLRAVTRD